jgi:hypothetical protein
MLKELCVSTFKVEYICSTLNALGLSRIHVRKGMSGTPPQDKKTHFFERMACFLLTLLWQRTYMHSVLRAKKRKGGCAPPVMPRTKQRRDRARLF